MPGDAMPWRVATARTARHMETGAWDPLRRHLLGVPQADQAQSLPRSPQHIWLWQHSLRPAQDSSHLVLSQEAHMGLGCLLGIVLSKAFQWDGTGPGERSQG